jgi:hypothetical protein
MENTGEMMGAEVVRLRSLPGTSEFSRIRLRKCVPNPQFSANRMCARLSDVCQRKQRPDLVRREQPIALDRFCHPDRFRAWRLERPAVPGQVANQPLLVRPAKNALNPGDLVFRASWPAVLGDLRPDALEVGRPQGIGSQRFADRIGKSLGSKPILPVGPGFQFARFDLQPLGVQVLVDQFKDRQLVGFRRGCPGWRTGQD